MILVARWAETLKIKEKNTYNPTKATKYRIDLFIYNDILTIRGTGHFCHTRTLILGSMQVIHNQFFLKKICSKEEGKHLLRVTDDVIGKASFILFYFLFLFLLHQGKILYFRYKYELTYSISSKFRFLFVGPFKPWQKFICQNMLPISFLEPEIPEECIYSSSCLIYRAK